jgi:N-acetylglutamate synthase-like GNAT family acetyltransferase
MLSISICTHYPAAQAFYAQCGYMTPITPEDTVITAQKHGRIVGIVRLCPEEGVLVLRGMEIAPACQRRGIGTKMLGALGGLIGERACWGVALDHLETFYGRIGFRFVPIEQAPRHLQKRIRQYTEHNAATGNPVVNRIMFRAERFNPDR